MSQLNPGDFPMTGNEEGSDLWPLLNRLAAAVVSNFAAPVRPAEITDGGLWGREEPDGTHTLMLYSDGRDVPLIASAKGGGVTADSLYTKTEVDNLISQVSAQVAALGEVPIGGIIMWSGSINQIPARYRLCDGGGGTPNLRDRFIVGAGGSYNIGATGGKDAITEVPAHDHTFSGTTSTTGNHNHGNRTGSGGKSFSFTIRNSNDGSDVISEESGISSSNDGTNGPTFDEQSPRDQQKLSYDAAHDHHIPTDGAHAHSFSGRTNTTGTSSVDIRPKYYALAFIRRMS